MKKVTLAFLILLSSITLSAQTAQGIDALIPAEYVNKSMGSVSKQVMGLESNVNVIIIAPLTELNSCRNNSGDGRIDVMIKWYNEADETGRFMLNMITDYNGIEQEKQSFLGQSGFYADEARFEEWESGNLWFTEVKKPCVNEISGPTGKTEFNTHARYFRFTGHAFIEIDINGRNSLAHTKEILKNMLLKIASFDFSALKNTTLAE